jgi:hypothetical protein
MIPIPEKFLPKVIKNHLAARILAGVLLVLLILVFALWQIRNVRFWEDDYKRLYALDRKITIDLFDSSVVGLRMFHSRFGHYPHTNGKYFLDSIKEYVDFDDIYVYADSLTANGDTLLIKKPVGEKFNYRSLKNIYFGIGDASQTIIYHYIEPDTFLLYSVGENCIDEGGKGDDIVYKDGK